MLIERLKGKSRRLKLTNKILQTLQPKWYLFPLLCMHFHSFGFLFNWTEFCLSGLLWTRCLVSGPQFLTREMVRFIVPTSQDSDGDSVSGHIWSLKTAHVIGCTQRMFYCYSQEHLKNTSIFVHNFFFLYQYIQYKILAGFIWYLSFNQRKCVNPWIPQ